MLAEDHDDTYGSTVPLDEAYAQYDNYHGGQYAEYAGDDYDEYATEGYEPYPGNGGAYVEHGYVETDESMPYEGGAAYEEYTGKGEYEAYDAGVYEEYNDGEWVEEYEVDKPYAAEDPYDAT